MKYCRLDLWILYFNIFWDILLRFEKSFAFWKKKNIKF
jgi:hypothetical protein